MSREARTAMSARRTSLLGALLAMLGPISMSIYTPAMPELVHAFLTTPSEVKLTLSVYFGGFALAQLVAGPFSDAFGRKTATLAFLGINLAGSLVCAFAPSIGLLILGRLIQGIGASVGITVARAIVRDQFTGAAASRIMNLIGIMLAIGPAMAPALGGLALSAFGWRSIFFLLMGFSLMTVLAILVYLRETTVPDRTRARPGRLVRAYGEILRDGRFLAAVGVLGGAIGALYAQSTMLSFILIDRVGLSPTAFGLSMLMQSGFYFLGSVVLRLTARWTGGERAVHVGLFACGLGGVMILASVHLLAPGFLSIMVPVAFSAFGIAFLTPHMTTVALQSFPHIAGSASAMMGFIQMGCGFLGGLAASFVGTPLDAFGAIIPAMLFTAVASYLVFRAQTRRQVLDRPAA